MGAKAEAEGKENTVWLMEKHIANSCHVHMTSCRKEDCAGAIQFFLLKKKQNILHFIAIEVLRQSILKHQQSQGKSVLIDIPFF